MTGLPVGARTGGGSRRPTTDQREIDQDRPIAPAEGRDYQGSTAMYGHLHQELARQRHREACLQARRVRVLRAVRAGRRARRAVELAVRDSERASGARWPATS